MSYRYIEDDDTKTTIRPATAAHATVWLSIESDGKKVGTLIPNADVPTVAAELLKAAGYDGLADLIGWDAAEKKLQERRDALTAELDGGAEYDEFHPTSPFRRAIDRIIELEDATSRD